MIVHPWGWPPRGSPYETGAFQYRENRMKTAMIAALSCAVLCVPLMTFSAGALQCTGGQANLTAESGAQRNFMFNRPMGMRFESIEYTIDVEGKAATELSDIPEPSDVDGMGLYVSVGSLEPKELKYVEKAGNCLQYRAWVAMTSEDASLITIWGEHLNDQPKICFDSSGKAQLKLLVDVNQKK